MLTQTRLLLSMLGLVRDMFSGLWRALTCHRQARLKQWRPSPHSSLPLTVNSEGQLVLDLTRTADIARERQSLKPRYPALYSSSGCYW